MSVTASVDDVPAYVVAEDTDGPELHQVATQVLRSRIPCFPAKRYCSIGLHDRLVEPERVLILRLPSVDDQEPSGSTTTQCWTRGWCDGWSRTDCAS